MSEIFWKGKPRPWLDQLIIRDLKETLSKFEPEFLIFHTVFLTDDRKGPSVFVRYSEENKRLEAEYCETTTWVTLDAN